MMKEGKGREGMGREGDLFLGERKGVGFGVCRC